MGQCKPARPSVDNFAPYDFTAYRPFISMLSYIDIFTVNIIIAARGEFFYLYKFVYLFFFSRILSIQFAVNVSFTRVVLKSAKGGGSGTG